MELMSERDFENYLGIFESILAFVRPPDLLIYLEASVPTLVNNIQLRGREYEAGIRLDYLSKLNAKYKKWIDGYTGGKVLILDKDALDFANNEQDLQFVLEQVKKSIQEIKSRKDE